MGGLRWEPARGRRNVEDRRAETAVRDVADAVDGPHLMTERQILMDELIRDEGVRLKVYADSLGIATIGVGRNLTGKGITFAEAMTLLDHDIDEAITDLVSFPWFEALDPVRQRVLINMRFNLGARGLRTFTRTLAAIAAGDYSQAATRMSQSKWARQVKGRATRLIAMMRTGDV